MKKNWVLIGVVGLLVAGGLVYLVSHSAADKYLTTTARSTKPAIVSCSVKGRGRTVSISNGQLSQTHVQAKACDTLTIINQDDTVREIAFGKHEHHVAYDGITERTMSKGDSVTITLDQLGTFTFHDHFHEEVAGDFTVTR